MQRIRHWIFLLAWSFVRLMAQNAPAPAAPQEPVPAAAPSQTIPILPDDGVRVAVLGYHDFSTTLKETEMRINTQKFRAQMQYLKDQGLSVISMADFTAWKQGKKAIPPRSVVITIDDGWSSVYTDAYPILKEFRYPFTIFLYTKYIDVKGRSMSLAMIKEMQKNGATIGNHSMSHPYPATVKSQQQKGPKSFAAYLEREMGESKTFLEKAFGQKVNTYCYPGGFHTEEMFVIGQQHQYDHMFTVLPGKIKRDTDDRALPRYVVLGTYDRIFELATEFRDASPVALGTAPKVSTPFPVSPEAGAIINTRLPVISIDLSSVTDVDPQTLVMRVGGFGDVPAVLDPETKQFRWQVNRRLRDTVCQVSVTWKKPNEKTTVTPVRWNFTIDKEAAYQPNGG
jgi:peptidoglycan/xylan/chitin deacetylase (PgdA/CDA1 family)